MYFSHLTAPKYRSTSMGITTGSMTIKMRTRRLTAFRFRTEFRLQAVWKPFANNLHPFERLGSSVQKNLHPFERLDHPFSRNVQPFERLCHPFGKNTHPSGRLERQQTPTRRHIPNDNFLSQ